MEMFEPAHPGAIVKDNLDALALSVAKAAEALSVDRSALHRVVSGKAAISPDMAVRLEAVIGSTADHWMRLQSAYDLAQARKRNAEIIKNLCRIPAQA